MDAPVYERLLAEKAPGVVTTALLLEGPDSVIFASLGSSVVADFLMSMSL